MKHRTDFYENVVKNIKSEAASDGQTNTVAQISKRVHMPQSTLHDKFHNPRRFTLEDLKQISDGLGTNVEQLVRVSQ